MKHKAYLSIKHTVNLFREIYPDFPLPMVLVLLEVAQDEGLTVSQVMKRTGLTQASASRHCRALTRHKSPNVAGLDLCEWRDDPSDFRSKRLYLNSQGK